MAQVKRTLLIDADIVAFKFASVTEEVTYFDGRENPPCIHHDTEEACRLADEYIAALQDRLSATDVIVCLSDPVENFRKDVWPDYKGNRTARRPTDLMAVKDHFKTKWQTYLRPRLEADDCMGILSTHPSIIRGEKIIVSEDKDMQTIPGLLFNPGKDEAPRKVSRLAAYRYWMAQTIIGDTCDNYPGAKGIGPKSPEVAAVMVSTTVEQMWRHVLTAFERTLARQIKSPDPVPPADLRAMASAMATAQARCARILRSSDWNFKEKRPILWMPPRMT